jgi:hypothetical protein
MLAEEIGKLGMIFALLTMLALWIHLGVAIAMGEHCFLCL